MLGTLGRRLSRNHRWVTEGRSEEGHTLNACQHRLSKEMNGVESIHVERVLGDYFPLIVVYLRSIILDDWEL